MIHSPKVGPLKRVHVLGLSHIRSSKLKLAACRIGDCWVNVSGTLLGDDKHAVSATVGLNVVSPGTVVTTPVLKSTVVPISCVVMISGTMNVGTLVLPWPLPLIVGFAPTIIPV